MPFDGGGMAALFNLMRKRRPQARASRVDTFIEAFLPGPKHRRQPVTVSDLSPGGFRAEAKAQLSPGAEIYVAFPGLGEVASRVVWVKGRTFGAEFIGPADLRRLFIAGLAAPVGSHMREAA
jgi:PilZ domain